MPEYLAPEEKATDRDEFHDGEILAMSGGTYPHSRTNTNPLETLGIRQGGTPCKPLDSNVRVRIAWPRSLPLSRYQHRLQRPDPWHARKRNRFPNRSIANFASIPKKRARRRGKKVDALRSTADRLQSQTDEPPSPKHHRDHDQDRAHAPGLWNSCSQVIDNNISSIAAPVVVDGIRRVPLHEGRALAEAGKRALYRSIGGI